MKRYIIVLFPYILLFIGIAYYHGENKNNQAVQTALTEQKNSVEQLISLLYGNMKMHYTYAERDLEDIILLNNNQKKVKLSSLVGEKEKLVFKFSPSNCSTCIQSGFAALRKIAKNISNDQIIIITDKTNRREIRALANSMNLDYPIYLADDKDFNNILQKENIPFTFIIDKDLRMKDLFIPMKELPDYSDMYYRIIWKKYFYK